MNRTGLPGSVGPDVFHARAHDDGVTRPARRRGQGESTKDDPSRYDAFRVGGVARHGLPVSSPMIDGRGADDFGGTGGSTTEYATT